MADEGTRLRAGWYPDPDVSARYRWWNGSQWTQWLSATRDEAFPPPGGEAVTPVPTRRDRVMRAVWIGLAVIAVVMAVMAGIGVVTNQRRADARPDVAWPRPVSPAATRTPADGYNDLYSAPDGRITLMDRFTVQAPASSGWTFRNEGKSSDLSPFFDPYLSTVHASKVNPQGSNGQFFVGVPEQSLIPETIGQTAPATMQALVQRTFGGDQNRPVGAKLRHSAAHPGLGEGLAAWRVTIDFVSAVNDAPLVLDAVFFQNSANEWFVVAMVIGGSVQGELSPEFDAAVASVRLIEK
ncbi:DUF2510 domain-containing protein [Aestuariimicrobium soli]|uniref:DUF2510 domain-containing protein n=1 Tax=Aestuariimicrobium soli TaxID=2035834 RepID=UPI003EBCFD68